jgi:FMN-dependent NADH-azoreductase
MANNILFVNACIRKNSRTLELANHVLNNLSGIINEVKLYEEELSPLTLTEMQIRDQAFKNKDFSNGVFNLAKQFASADIIVIASPYWDLSFPAIVKTYFEKICVNGLTFAYGENGIPHGLCNAKKLIYVTTSGGPIVYNFGFDYVNALAKCFYGITEVQCVTAQGLDIHGADVSGILAEAKRSFNS